MFATVHLTAQMLLELYTRMKSTQTIEDQGDFVKIHIANDEVGYVSKSGITIKTQFARSEGRQ